MFALGTIEQMKLNGIILQEESEGGEGSEGDKKEIKKPSGAPLFDDEMEQDSKANVKEKAEELRKQGCKYLTGNHFVQISTSNMILIEIICVIFRWSQLFS